jgi:hypothetical protein
MKWKSWKSVAVLLVVAGVWAAPSQAQTLFSLAPDPADYPIGFTRAHWVSSINKMIVAYGYTDPEGGDNSVRAYDPATDTWEYLWSNDYTNGGPQQRDDHNSLYIPKLDEFWVWGGSRLETLPGALRSGRFSIRAKTWLATSTTDEGAFSGVVQGFGGGHSNGATAWSDALDSGLIFGGDEEGNGSNRFWIIEPNPAGPEPYRMFEVYDDLRPPPRLQAINLLAAAGTDFYLLGGFANQIEDQYIFVNDFWRFDGLARTWHELPSPPTVGYQSTLSYDSDRNALIAWVDDKMYAYWIELGAWFDITPPGMPCNFNHVAAYSPTVWLHLFFGGNLCNGDSSFMATALRVNELEPKGE